MHGSQLEFVVIGNDVAAARELADAIGAIVYVDDRVVDGLAFRTLVRAVTDRPTVLAPAADVGTYVVLARPQKIRYRPVDKRSIVVQINAMVASEALSSDTADSHWRDVHAPLALRHHVGMTQYTQLSVVHTLDGEPYRGFALCEFDTEADFRDRFYDGPDGQQAIHADIAKFADMKRSPRRLIARPI